MCLFHVMSRQQKLLVIFLLFTGWVYKGVDFTLYRVWVPLSWLKVGVDVVNS